MGLDITAISHAARVEGCHAEDCSLEHHKVYVNPAFPERADGLPDGSCWTARGLDRFDFRAGSYSGYNYWRDSLSKMALGVPSSDVFGNEAYRGKPFYELIDFADNEGTIGSATSKKLHADFMGHMEQARQFAIAQGVDYFYEKFLEWEKAFAMAADGGFVDFH
jgi:hypothetical protein